MKRILFFLTISLLGQLSLTGQVDTLSPWIGPTISQAEYQYYRLGSTLRYKNERVDSLQIEFRDVDGRSVRFIHWYLRDEASTYQPINHVQRKALLKRIGAVTKPRQLEWAKLNEYVSAGDTPAVSVRTFTDVQLTGQAYPLGQDQLRIQTEIGQVDLALEQIAALEIRAIENVRPTSRFLFPNPSSTRYLFAPSAIPLKRGENYYQNIFLTVNSLNYGITDHVALSVGTELISLLASAFVTDFFVFPGFANVKFASQVKDNLYLGGGMIGGGYLSRYERAGGGILYGVGTVGNIERNATLGLGVGNAGYRSGSYRSQMGLRPVISLNGMSRVSKRIALVSENWYFPSSFSESSNGAMNQVLILSMGMRVLTPDVSFDLSLLGIASSYVYYDSFDPATYEPIGPKTRRWDWVPLPIPFLGLVYRFGRY